MFIMKDRRIIVKIVIALVVIVILSVILVLTKKHTKEQETIQNQTIENNLKSYYTPINEMQKQYNKDSMKKSY